MSRHDPSLAHEFAAALAWWRMAGVDCDFADDATAWLGETPAAPPADPQRPDGIMRRDAAAPPGERADGAPRSPLPPLPSSAPIPRAVPRRDWLGDSPPADLAAFRRWWTDAPDLAPATGHPRILPRGEAGAALMVLVPQPEAEDRERLMSGPQGRLLANILAAIGLEEREVYVASALPCHLPLADLPALAAGGMDAVTAHHVGLVAPARLVAFGTGLGAMLGAPGEASLREINHAGRTIPVLASETLEALMDSPRLKARFWRRWIEWSATI